MKHIIFLFLVLVTLSVCAQNSISGKLTDSNTKETIPFVTVYFPEIEKGGVSDAEGNFFIHHLPSGNYKMLFSIIGYETLSMEVAIPEQTFFNIELSPSAIEMEEIIISTPFHKLQSENVMKVAHEKIAELNANGAMSLADGITDIAGVESVTTGSGIGKPVIRGLSSNRVLVYTQGVRLENQQFGDEHGLGISDSGIESVEVIKGPASLLYGSDALGGVLYFNPEKFANAKSSSADVNFNYFSNTRGYSTNAGYKASEDEFKYLFRGSVAEHADYNTKSYRVTNSRFRELDFKAGIGYQVTQFKTELRYNANHSKIGIPEEIGSQSTERTPLLPYQDITNHILSSKSRLFFKNSSLDVNLGLLYNDRQEFEEHHDEIHDEIHDEEHEDSDALEPALQMKLKTFNYDIKYSLPKLNKFEVIVGFQGMFQENTNYGEETLISDATTNDLGLLAMSHIHFEKADIQIGVRFDNRAIHIQDGISKNFNSFNGALGIKTNLAEQITARLNFASGFRAPNLAELTSNGTHEGANRYEIGNLNLKNERNIQLDLALEFKNEHVELFTNAFYNVIDNYIYLNPNGDVIDNDAVYLYEQNDANLYGGELGLHFHPHPLDWLHIESSFESVTGKQSNGAYLPLIPANSIKNVIRLEYDTKHIKKGYAYFKLSSIFNKDDVSNFETTTSGYNILSAGFGGSVMLFNHQLTVTLSGNNLSNTTYINHLSRLKPDGIFNMGRNFNLGINYTL